MTDLNLQLQKAIEAIREHAPTHLQDQLISLLRPAVALQFGFADDAELALGRSKFGGAPDVPTDFEWPVWYDRPLGFVAQINLEDIAPFDLNHVLPATGLLSFFYDSEAWDKEGNEVYWFEDTASLQRFDLQANPEMKALMRTCYISPLAYIELPSWLETHHLIDGEMVETDYYEIAKLPYDSAFRPVCPDDSGHKMLGYGNPEIIPQYDGDRNVELFTPPGTPDYHPLLQMMSDDHLGVMWGDVGTIDFMIHKDHMAARRFKDAQLTGTNG